MTLNTWTGPVRMNVLATWKQVRGSDYAVAYNDLPSANVERRPASVTLSWAQRGSVANIHGQLLSSRSIIFGGYPGREFAAKVQEGTYHARILLVGQRMYQLTVLVPTGGDTVGITRFMRSFVVSAAG